MVAIVLSTPVTQRPAYHFAAPPGGWINDPVGTIHHKGIYHLYYQLNPHSTSWDAPYWGHVYSEDLVHWKSLPPSLIPSTPYENEGCWSGSAFKINNLDDQVYFWYTAAQPQTQCIATSSDPLLQKFTRAKTNPVVPYSAKPSRFNEAFRDPQLFMVDDSLIMLLGGGLKNRQGGAVLKYVAKNPDFMNNLFNFKYNGTLLEDDGFCSQDLLSKWECPVLFNIGDYYGLLLSVEHEEPSTTYIIIGNLDQKSFKFEPLLTFLFDPGVYAPRTFVMDNNEVVIVSWIPEDRDVVQDYSGLLSIPKRTAIGMSVSNHYLYQHLRNFASFEYYFHNNLETLRLDHKNLIADPKKRTLIGYCANGCEVLLDSSISDYSKPFVLEIFSHPQQKEFTIIEFNFEKGEVLIDRSNSSLSDNQNTSSITIPLLFDSSKPNVLTIHLLIDRTVAELIVNHRSLATTRIYPLLSNSNQIYVHSFFKTRIEYFNYKPIF
ncbi:hypothetical protein P9112_014074 [Eukaryota sp. TZLM1-RC]